MARRLLRYLATNFQSKQAANLLHDGGAGEESAIIELVCAGHSAKDIISTLKYPPATVYAMIKRFKARGSSGRSKHSPRSDKKRTPKFLSDLDKSIMANPGESMTSLAKKHSVHHMIISRAIRHDLGYKSYALQVRHLLTAKMKDVRVTRCKKILNSLKSTGGHLRFFSDEKVFTLDRKGNRQNDRWICTKVFRTKKPASVMVLGIISSAGHVMPLHFFKLKERVNQKVYLNVLRDVVMPWMDTVAAGAKYTFQQDSVPAHKAKTIQASLKDNIPHFWDPQTWPSNSPDLNPCDQYL